MMHHLLTLEQPTSVPDGGGGLFGGWLNLGQHWARITQTQGSEVYAASRYAQRVTHKITLRYVRDGGKLRPRADQRFRLRDRIYAIKAVFDADSRGRHLTCLCEQGGVG